MRFVSSLTVRSVDVSGLCMRLLQARDVSQCLEAIQVVIWRIQMTRFERVRRGPLRSVSTKRAYCSMTQRQSSCRLMSFAGRIIPYAHLYSGFVFCVSLPWSRLNTVSALSL